MDDDELLGGWLDGDLDEETRLHAHARLEDPEFAARADRAAALVRALRGVDRVTPPPDLPDRLLARLEAPPAPQDEAPPTADTPAAESVGRRHTATRPTRPSTAPHTRRAHPARGTPRRTRGRTRGSRLTTVALVVVLVAGGAGVVGAFVAGLAPGGEDSVESATPGAQDAVEESAAGASADRAPRAPAGAEGAPPVLVDENLTFETQATASGGDEAAADRLDAELRARLLDAPEAQGLLGTPVAAAADLAAAARGRLAEAPAFDDGTRPDACLDDVTAGVQEGSPVVVRVESLTLDGRGALAYVLVLAESGRRLDTVEAWVVDPASCDTRRFLAG